MLELDWAKPTAPVEWPLGLAGRPGLVPAEPSELLVCKHLCATTYRASPCCAVRAKLWRRNSAGRWAVMGRGGCSDRDRASLHGGRCRAADRCTASLAGPLAHCGVLPSAEPPPRGLCAATHNTPALPASTLPIFGPPHIPHLSLALACAGHTQRGLSARARFHGQAAGARPRGDRDGGRGGGHGGGGGGGGGASPVRHVCDLLARAGARGQGIAR